jgi:hypothetical protein
MESVLQTPFFLMFFRDSQAIQPEAWSDIDENPGTYSGKIQVGVHGPMDMKPTGNTYFHKR